MVTWEGWEIIHRKASYTLPNPKIPCQEQSNRACSPSGEKVEAVVRW